MSVFVYLDLCLSQLAVSICQSWPLSFPVGCQYLSILTFAFLSWMSVFVNLVLCLSHLVSVCVNLVLCFPSWLSVFVDIDLAFLSWMSVFVNLVLCLSHLVSVCVNLVLCLSQLDVSICQSWPFSFSVGCQYLSILTFVFPNWLLVFVNGDLCFSQLDVSICQSWPLSFPVGCQYLTILTFFSLSWLSVFVNIELCLSQLAFSIICQYKFRIVPKNYVMKIHFFGYIYYLSPCHKLYPDFQ